MKRRARALFPLLSASVVGTSLLALFACGDGPTPPAGQGGMGGGASSSSASSSSTGAIVSSGAGAMGGGLPEVFVVSGIVTDGSAPVEGATVMQGGAEPLFVTGPDGTFSIELTQSIPGVPTLVAGKTGYRSAGIEIVDLADGPYTLVLREITTPDNPGYVFLPPGTGIPDKDTTAFCGHCHTTYVAEFLTSAHARAARNPLVWDLYTGSASAYADEASCLAHKGTWKTGLLPGSGSMPSSRCYLGAGVLSDLNGCGKAGSLACDDPALPIAEKPTQFGACANCHAAGLDGKLGGRDLLEAKGLAYENGNHCDVCHKVRDIDLSKPAGTAGRLLMQRPNETELEPTGEKPVQVMYGPFLDVPVTSMGGSKAPVFEKSMFCAGCHELMQPALMPGASLDPRFPLGVPILSTYSEWQSSTWGMSDVNCQFCHMPSEMGFANSLDVTTPDKAGIPYGFVRPSERTRSHTFRGPLTGSPRLLDSALGLSLAGMPMGNRVDVSVTLRNEGCGHALPTGEPMRALVLLVHAEACGQSLLQESGPTVPDLGGALADGIVGQAVIANGQTFTWAEAAALAKPGQVVRVVRETGQWEDDPGFGYFGDPSRTPPEKGIPRRAWVGEANIVTVAGSALSLDQPISVLDGDRVYLGDPWTSPLDGAPSRALAGSAGRAFARVLSDGAGARQVAQHQALALESDNRLLPFVPVTVAMSFAMPPNCTEAKVEATVVYRPIPLRLAREKGVDAKDFLVEQRVETITGF